MKDVEDCAHVTAAAAAVTVVHGKCSVLCRSAVSRFGVVHASCFCCCQESTAYTRFVPCTAACNLLQVTTLFARLQSSAQQNAEQHKDAVSSSQTCTVVVGLAAHMCRMPLGGVVLVLSCSFFCVTVGVHMCRACNSHLA
jgi:hypothetical protein